MVWDKFPGEMLSFLWHDWLTSASLRRINFTRTLSLFSLICFFFPFLLSTLCPFFSCYLVCQLGKYETSHQTKLTIKTKWHMSPKFAIVLIFVFVVRCLDKQGFTAKITHPSSSTMQRFSDLCGSVTLMELAKIRWKRNLPSLPSCTP